MIKYKVPHGLKQAISEGFHATVSGEAIYEKIGLYIVRWLSENPIVPTSEQLQGIATENGRGNCYPENIELYVTEFQKIMFIEPEYPNELASLLHHWEFLGEAQSAEVKKRLVEAYEIGKKNRD